MQRLQLLEKLFFFLQFSSFAYLSSRQSVDSCYDQLTKGSQRQ